jgi:Isoprenylcysteine carboxyl methyltransferase (ICMT) family
MRPARFWDTISAPMGRSSPMPPTVRCASVRKRRRNDCRRRQNHLVDWRGRVVRHHVPARLPVAPTTQRPESARERVLMLISLTGLFLISASMRSPAFRGLPTMLRPMRASIGVVVLVCAGALSFHSHRRLGWSWSVTLEIRENRGLVTDGIYRFVRHPVLFSPFPGCSRRRRCCRN